MAPPIYFFPRVRLAELVVGDRLNPEQLVPRGLGRTFLDCESVRKDCSCFELTGIGPGDASGCMLTALPTDPARKPIRLTFEKRFQDWHPFEHVKGCELWVGIDREHPPEPADLARKRLVDGYTVEAGPYSWQIPIIRNPEGGSSLPSEWEMEADGRVVENIRGEYRQLWDGFAGVVDMFFDPDDPTPAGLFHLPRDEAMAHCLDVLSLNYRFDRYTQNLLHVVDGDNWNAILSSACDLPTFWAAFEACQGKKKARDAAAREATPESSNTSAGPEDSSPTTDPAAESSPPPPDKSASGH